MQINVSPRGFGVILLRNATNELRKNAEIALFLLFLSLFHLMKTCGWGCQITDDLHNTMGGLAPEVEEGREGGRCRGLSGPPASMALI